PGQVRRYRHQRDWIAIEPRSRRPRRPYPTTSPQCPAETSYRPSQRSPPDSHHQSSPAPHARQLTTSDQSQPGTPSQVTRENPIRRTSDRNSRRNTSRHAQPRTPTNTGAGNHQPPQRVRKESDSRRSIYRRPTATLVKRGSPANYGRSRK